MGFYLEKKKKGFYLSLASYLSALQNKEHCDIDQVNIGFG